MQTTRTLLPSSCRMMSQTRPGFFAINSFRLAKARARLPNFIPLNHESLVARWYIVRVPLVCESVRDKHMVIDPRDNVNLKGYHFHNFVESFQNISKSLSFIWQYVLSSMELEHVYGLLGIISMIIPDWLRTRVPTRFPIDLISPFDIVQPIAGPSCSSVSQCPTIT